MKLSKVYTALLAVLGVQLPSCIKLEYGTSYAYFVNQGVVSDEAGKGISHAKIVINKIDSIAVDTSGKKFAPVLKTITETHTNDKGAFSKKEELFASETMNCQIITTKENYQPDTSYFHVNKTDFVGGYSRNAVDYDGTAKKFHHIVLKENKK